MPPEPEIPVDPTSAVATDALAAQLTEPTHAHPSAGNTQCLNCGTALQGPFCHQCGQHDFDVHRSFGHVALEALENFFHFDAKFFRNLFTLIFRPGVLTAEFIAGKRVSQMPPLRLYIFVSVLFFFTNFVAHDPGSAEAARVTVAQRSKAFQESLAQGIDTAAAGLGESDRGRNMHKIAEEMRAQPALPERINPATPPRVNVAPGMNVSLAESNETKFEKFLSEKGRHALEDPRAVREAFSHALPKMLLVCLPLFALYTRFLFRRSGHAYLQHLILALHFHTFIFLFMLARSGWTELAGFAHLDGFLRLFTNLWLAAYPVLMLRHLFGESWPRAILKTIALVFVYGGTLLIGFFVTIAVVFLVL